MLTNRNRHAIQQYARVKGHERSVDEVFQILEAILPRLGNQSKSRPMVNRIGYLLLSNRVTIVAPSCPDYSHKNSCYTFDSLGDNVPLLAKMQVRLLDEIVKYISNCICEILVADQESEDELLQSRLRVTKTEFEKAIGRSVRATRAFVEAKSYKVTPMTKRFPKLRELEKQFAEALATDAKLRQRIITDTMSRSNLYHKLGLWDFEAMKRRTIKTAAQYCALAKIAADGGLLVCNHDTVNLTWYNLHGCAVLHNAVSIY